MTELTALPVATGSQLRNLRAHVYSSTPPFANFQVGLEDLMAASAVGYYPEATAQVPKGLKLDTNTALVPGSGGTDGIFTATWSGGNFTVNPRATFKVRNGRVDWFVVDGPGLCVNASPVAPTVSLSASTGLTGATIPLTVDALVASGETWWGDHASDADLWQLYRNNAGVAAELTGRTALKNETPFADEAAMIAAAAADVEAAAAANASYVTSCAASATAAQGYQLTAFGYSEAARAAAEAAGPVKFYDTKAAANAALSGLPEGQIVEVSADESQSGERTRYAKTSGAYVYKMTLAPAINPVTGEVTIRPRNYSTLNGIAWAIRPTQGSPDLIGKNRTYFDPYGGLASQAYANFSGVYRNKSNGDIDVVPPGGLKAINNNKVLFMRYAGGGGAMIGASNDVLGGGFCSQNNALGGYYYNPRNIRIAVAGSGYAVGDVLTFVGGTISPVVATSVFGILVGGTGHAVNDVITLGGGDPITRATIRVTGVSAGGIVTTAVLESAGSYRRFPQNNYDQTQYATTGSGTGLSVAMEWELGGATQIVVRGVSADGLGRITDFEVVKAGRYVRVSGGSVIAAPPSPIAVTGGTGTGATFKVDWSKLGSTSFHQSYLNGNGVPDFYIEEAGELVWNDSTKLTEREGSVTGKVNLFRQDKDTVRSWARGRFDQGLWTEQDQFSVLGHERRISMVRTVPTAAGDTIYLGKMKMQAGATAWRVRAAYNSCVIEWEVPVVWSAGSHTEGGQAYGTAWAVVPARLRLHQNSQKTFDLDIKQDAASGDVWARLRATNGVAAVDVDIELDFMASSSRETVTTVSPAARFDQMWTTETGVTAPTRIWMNSAKAMLRREAYQYETPATGTTVTVAEGCPKVVLDPAATIAALTVTLPGGAVDGQIVEMSTTREITALTVNSATGSVKANGVTGPFAAGASRAYIYRLASTQWLIC